MSGISASDSADADGDAQASVSATACADQHRSTSLGCAPSASRTPTSCVRSLTSSDITP